MLSLVFIFRSPDSMLPGREPYFLARAASDIGIYDELSFGGRFASYPMGTPLVLHLIPQELATLAPLILGILSFVLFALLLKDLGIKHARIALMALITSPAFIYMFGTLGTAAFAMFLSLLGFWIFSRKSAARMLAVPVFAVLPLFDPAMALITILLLFFYAFFAKKERKKLFIASLLCSLASASLYYGFVIKNAGFARPLFDSLAGGINPALQSLISDLGAASGIGVFALLLAVFGVIAIWDDKYRNLFAFFSLALLVLLSLFIPKAVLFLNLFVCVFAAYGVMYIYNARWESRLFQRFVLLILVCGILFSAVSFAGRFVASEPGAAVISAVSSLGSMPEGTVFSHYTRGFWINYAGHKNVMDENMWFVKDVNERWKDSQELFYTRDLPTALKLLEKYNVTYIWIDSGMKSMLWKDDEEGLLFLLKYNRDFKDSKVYDEDGVEIWKVKSD